MPRGLFHNQEVVHMFERVIETPIGPMTLRSDGQSLTAASFGNQFQGASGACAILDRAEAELGEYFAGKRQAFDIPLAPAGTDFQRRVWAALREIPYGQTATYRDIALRVDNPRGFRAVGLANNRNPLPIFIPCHRVVGADGSLTGYAGGLEAKRLLLELEAAAGAAS